MMAAEMAAEITCLVSEGRGFTPNDQAIAKARTERLIGRYMEDKRTMYADDLPDDLPDNLPDDPP